MIFLFTLFSRKEGRTKQQSQSKDLLDPGCQPPLGVGSAPQLKASVLDKVTADVYDQKELKPPA